MPAPPTVSDNDLAQRHYVVQLALAETLAKAIQKIRVAPTSPDYLDAVAALVYQYQLAAIALAVEYYQQARDAADVDGPYRIPVVTPWALAAIVAYLRAAAATVDATRFAEMVSDVAQNLAISAGTDQLFSAISGDPTKVRWARVTRPDACSFCLMLATRGAVYRTEQSGSFRAHVKCRCDVEMAFSTATYEAPAHIRAAQRLWADSTAGVSGTKAKLNAFRRALDAERNGA
jgi:hypothetical protein